MRSNIGERLDEKINVSFNYKSYSYRLIGQIYACKGDYPSAVSALRSSIDFTPNYYVAFYDLAKYSAQMQDKDTCLSALKSAIIGDSIYFYLVEKEKDFASLQSEVSELLNKIKTGVFNEANAIISKTKELLNASEKLAFELNIGTVRLKDARSKLEFIENEIKLSDYKSYLNAIYSGKNAYDIADGFHKTMIEISKAQEMIQDAERAFAEVKIAMRKCSNKEKVLESVVSDLHSAKTSLKSVKDHVIVEYLPKEHYDSRTIWDYYRERDYLSKIQWQKLKSTLECANIAKTIYDLAVKSKNEIYEIHKHYEETRYTERGKRRKEALITSFKGIGYSVLFALCGGLLGAFMGCSAGCFSGDLSMREGAGGGSIIGSILGVVSESLNMNILTIFQAEFIKAFSKTSLF